MFPNESSEYRNARAALLDAEIALRGQVEKVAALRRALPAGGAVPADYAFESAAGRVTLSGLFAAGKDTLVAYSFMYGPAMEKACPMCTAFLDSLDGAALHLLQRVNLAVIARSPLPRVLEHARARGWRNLPLLSSAGNDYNRDYHAENAQGSQWPMMNVFVKREGRVLHSYGTEMFHAPAQTGQHPRHVDLMWPLWGVLDLTPGGRGDFMPKLSYG